MPITPFEVAPALHNDTYFAKPVAHRLNGGCECMRHTERSDACKLDVRELRDVLDNPFRAQFGQTVPLVLGRFECLQKLSWYLATLRPKRPGGGIGDHRQAVDFTRADSGVFQSVVDCQQRPRADARLGLPIPAPQRWCVSHTSCRDPSAVLP